MPLYPMQCTKCEKYYEILQSMSERGSDRPYPPSDCCSAQAARIYTPQADPNGESAFKSFYSEQLSDGLDPVEIRSRAQLKGELLARGLRQYDGDEFREQMKGAQRAKDEKRNRALDAESRILHQAGLNPERERAHHREIRAQNARRP